MLKCYTLFSGSQGNCVYVRNENAEILIDAGKSCGAIEKALLSLGTSLGNINAIFITHEHSDHTCGLEIISKKYRIPVYMTAPSYDAYVKERTYLSSVCERVEVGFEEKIGTLCLKSFEIPHDSAQNVGYIISSSDEKIGIATDIGFLTDTIEDSLSKCQRVILEANHDVEMLKKGAYPQFLKARILSKGGHLSNKSCATLVCRLARAGVKGITLAHLSQENNTPRVALEACYSALKNEGCECKLQVASPSLAVCVTE